MDTSSGILTPRQLPTPADSPVFFRTDPATFQLPQNPQSQPERATSISRAIVKDHLSTIGEDMGPPRTSSRRSSIASSSGSSIWSIGDRFIPSRKSSSQTSFDLLPPLASTSTSIPRSQSAPLQTKRFTGYSAHEVAKTREYAGVLRSELLGRGFAVDTPSAPSSRLGQQFSSRDRKKLPRQPSSTKLHGTSFSTLTRSPPPVLSFSPTPSASPSSSRSSASDSPLSQAYRLSPFNSTTERFLSSSPSSLPRKICLTPCRVLDAPNLSDNFYESSLDWSLSNHLLAVALGSQVFTWKSNGQVTRIVSVQDLQRAPKVTSVEWIPKSDHIGTGKSNGQVSIYDASTCQQIRQLSPHSNRVGVLSTLSNQVLTSGSADRLIFQRDLRMKDEVVRVIKGFKGEITSLSWNEEGELASGGNDNSVRLFKGFDEKPFLKLRKAHSAAIKALAWSPHQRGLLATGGGTEDQNLRFWNTRTGELLKEIETGSQVCQIVWSNTTNEIVSAHGFSSRPETDNCVHIWRYSNSPTYVPPYNPIASLASGRGRNLHSALSPDGRYIVCGSSDEVLRFWDVFPPQIPVNESIIVPSSSSTFDVSGIIR